MRGPSNLSFLSFLLCFSFLWGFGEYHLLRVVGKNVYLN